MNRRGFIKALLAIPVAASLPPSVVARVLSAEARETAVIKLLESRIAATRAMFAAQIAEVVSAEIYGPFQPPVDTPFPWREVVASITIR